MALLTEGKEFALNQVASGVPAFSVALNEELDPFRDAEMEGLDEENGNDSVLDGDGGADDVEDDEGEVEEAPIERDFEVPSLEPIRSEGLANDIFVWRFPE